MRNTLQSKTLTKTALRTLVGTALVVLMGLTPAALARPLTGDPVHGEKVFKKAKGKLKVDGAWLNAVTDTQAVKLTKTGKKGFPKVASENVLDHYDAVAYVRSRNVDVRDLVDGASNMLVSTGKLDKYASERLSEAGIKVNKGQKKGRVFAFFKLKRRGADLRITSPKNTKVRDKLKPKRKVGYASFQPLVGLREGGYEVGFSTDVDMKVVAIEIRGPDGVVPEDLNRAAQRLVGKGERGKYDRLRLVGAGKAVRELEESLSNAILVGMEQVYMYEVEERDYFAFE